MTPQQPAPLSLALSVDEINQILEALGTQPYAKVFQLIQKIHQQAQAQMSPPSDAEGARPA
jgi:hypothetical protein